MSARVFSVSSLGSTSDGVYPQAFSGTEPFRGRSVVDPKTETRLRQENRGHLSAIMEQADEEEEEEAEELQHRF